MPDQETKARETAEQALEGAANRATDFGQKLAEQIAAAKRIEASLTDAGAQMQLRQEANDKEAAEAAKMKAKAEARAAIEKLALEIKAREAASKRLPVERRALPDPHRKSTASETKPNGSTAAVLVANLVGAIRAAKYITVVFELTAISVRRHIHLL
jgi:hypothetical protein